MKPQFQVGITIYFSGSCGYLSNYNSHVSPSMSVFCHFITNCCVVCRKRPNIGMICLSVCTPSYVFHSPSQEMLGGF